MIIYADKGYETRSDVPDSDWTGSALYVVPDGSELAQRITAAYPYYDFVTDGDGKLVDIIETERPPEPDMSVYISESDALAMLFGGV